MRSLSSSCHDGFGLRGGLLPQRGGEGVQTDQRRDREATAAGQEGRQAGAEAAAAGYVTAGGPPGPRGWLRGEIRIIFVVFVSVETKNE